MITIYTRKFCGFCTMAKQLLTSKGLDFVEHDATLRLALRSEMIEKSNGGWTFPQIFIGETHIGGCTELLELDRRGDLDRMLKELPV